VTGDFAPELKKAIETIREAAASAGKKSGIYATSGEQARAYADQGFNMVCFVLLHVALLAVADDLFADLCRCRRSRSSDIHV
jgi:2-keto-3-deoxy-L-rhamnonate aldolase RhmA